VLTRLGPLKLEVISHEYYSHNNKGETLAKLVEHKTKSHVEKGLLGLVLGPLKYDAERVHDAIKGLGCVSPLISELQLMMAEQDERRLTQRDRPRPYSVGRRAALIRIPAEIQRDAPPGRAGRSERGRHEEYTPLPAPHLNTNANAVHIVFGKILAPTRTLLPAPGLDVSALTQDDVHALHRAGAARLGTDEGKFYDVLTGRTHAHLVQICRAYPAVHKKHLSDVLNSELCVFPPFLALN
jgi:hypothetical protein